jgi:hypothetical protein
MLQSVDESTRLSRERSTLRRASKLLEETIFCVRAG